MKISVKISEYLWALRVMSLSDFRRNTELPQIPRSSSDPEEGTSSTETPSSGCK